MGFRFRKSFYFGPFRANFSQKGVGSSFSFLGFRFGVSSDGRKYCSFGLIGTGLYYIKYY